MAIANGTCVSFCNQPKAHYLATSRESRRYVVAFSRCGYCIWLRRESKAHFGLPWVRPWDNRGKCYMDRKRIQCLSNSSQHVPSIFNRFPVIQAVSLNVRHFSTFFAHFCLPWGRPWDNRGKCYMDRKSLKRIQCWSNASQDVCIYLQPFTSYSEILVGNCNFYLPPCT